MSCILRISGDKLDIDNLPKKLSIKPTDIRKKGQPYFESKPNSRRYSTNILQFLISNHNFSNINKQIKDAIKYLKKNKSDIKKMTLNKHVTNSLLDFGHDLRIGYNDIATQFDYFPHELLKLAGDLKIDIGSSLYPPDLEEQARRRVDGKRAKK